MSDDGGWGEKRVQSLGQGNKKAKPLCLDVDTKKKQKSSRMNET